MTQDEFIRLQREAEVISSIDITNDFYTVLEDLIEDFEIEE